jgi:hypothetical protein
LTGKADDARFLRVKPGSGGAIDVSDLLSEVEDRLRARVLKTIDEFHGLNVGFPGMQFPNFNGSQLDDFWKNPEPCDCLGAITIIMSTSAQRELMTSAEFTSLFTTQDFVRGKKMMLKQNGKGLNSFKNGDWLYFYGWMQRGPNTNGKVQWQPVGSDILHPDPNISQNSANSGENVIKVGPDLFWGFFGARSGAMPYSSWGDLLDRNNPTLQSDPNWQLGGFNPPHDIQGRSDDPVFFDVGKLLQQILELRVKQRNQGK